MSDPLFPSTAGLPLSARSGGSVLTPLTTPRGPLPLAVSLGVRPIECGKHESTATKYHKNVTTKHIIDGTEERDTIVQENTDT